MEIFKFEMLVSRTSLSFFAQLFGGTVCTATGQPPLLFIGPLRLIATSFRKLDIIGDQKVYHHVHILSPRDACYIPTINAKLGLNVFI